MISDDQDIRDVMHDEFRAARGKPPVHTTSDDQRKRIKQAMLIAIQECNEADYINCVLDLGHKPGSVEYERMMTLWNQWRGGKK